jgi:hypothetical protein
MGMNVHRKDLLPFAGIAIALLIASVAPLWSGTAEPPVPVTQSEITRIQEHLRTVESELLRRDLFHLSVRQQSARMQHIQLLREYRERGLFPHNHDNPERQLPFFVDHQGTHCAVAYLLARSGRSDLVQRVAQGRNNAYVAELADDPEMVAWLDSAGLSLQEAARIQPMYNWQPQEETSRVSTEYALLSALSLGFGSVSIATNLPGNREAPGWRGAYGLVIGAYGIALGVPKLDAGGTPQVLGVLNTAVGATAALLGARTLWQGSRRHVAAVPENAPASGVTVTAAPLLGVDGRAGVSMQVKY